MKRLHAAPIALAILVVLVPAAVLAKGAPVPTWSQHLTKGRFTALRPFGGNAVLDKETGLVWEQSPDASTRTWVDALAHCYQREVGARKGWRLPTLEELASLVDASQADPSLPVGHAFANVQSAAYWSATTSAGDTANAWYVHFGSGGVDFLGKSASERVWCVRGGQGIDGVQ